MNDSALTEYLAEIIDRSQRGDIFWTQPNPSTYQWNEVAKEKHFVVTIQKASAQKLKGLSFEEEVSYLFQVVDKSNKQTLLSLSSKERPEFSKILGGIYRGAELGMDLRASSILQELLRR